MSNSSAVEVKPDAFLVRAQQEFAQARAEHPEWSAQFEDADPVTAEREVVEALLESAPTPFLAGLLVGFMMFRQQMAIITGRPF